MHHTVLHTAPASPGRRCQHDVELDAQPLQALGLTKREAEVLLWISQGKRNGEIGTILQTSKRTVGKHVERILCKLEVETRTAAAIVAFDFMGRAETRTQR